MLRWLKKNRTSAGPVAPGTAFSRSRHVVAAGEEGRMVLLDPVGGEYFGLDEVGARIWELLPAHPTAAGLAERLTQEYDAPRERLQADAAAFLGQLAGLGLVARR